MMTGGVAKNAGLVKCLKEKLGEKLVINDKAQLSGAFVCHGNCGLIEICKEESHQKRVRFLFFVYRVILNLQMP